MVASTACSAHGPVKVPRWPPTVVNPPWPNWVSRRGAAGTAGAGLLATLVQSSSACAVVYSGPLTANMSLYVASDVVVVIPPLVTVVAGTTITVCTELPAGVRKALTKIPVPSAAAGIG